MLFVDMHRGILLSYLAMLQLCLPYLSFINPLL